MAGEVLMRVENLSLHAGGRELQHGLGFDVHAGEVLAICGASGCGKSTLLRHMIGLQTPLRAACCGRRAVPSATCTATTRRGARSAWPSRPVRCGAA
jgi:ABC-type transporter Mla maintaining outer membrane lipid asymmetry ATPase subunit MlaF